METAAQRGPPTPCSTVSHRDPTAGLFFGCLVWKGFVCVAFTVLGFAPLEEKSQDFGRGHIRTQLEKAGTEEFWAGWLRTHSATPPHMLGSRACAALQPGSCL